MRVIDELLRFLGIITVEPEDDDDTIENEITEDTCLVYENVPKSENISPDFDEKILQTILYMQNMDYNIFPKTNQTMIIHGDFYNNDMISAKNIFITGNVVNNGFCYGENVSSISGRMGLQELREVFLHELYRKKWLEIPDNLVKFNSEDNVDKLTKLIIDVVFTVLEDFEGADESEIIAFTRKVLDESSKHKKK